MDLTTALTLMVAASIGAILGLWLIYLVLVRGIKVAK